MSCDCITIINKSIETKGLRLETAFRFGKDMKLMTTFTPIHTEKIDLKNRQVKPHTFMPSYCPFCGKKLEDK